MTRRQVREARRRRSRRLRALLAAGVVLGVGATATLAAWNDSEYASGSFTAGEFGIVGSIDGSTFSEHSSPGAAASLSFQLPPTAMAPGNTVYALFAVKTTGGSVAGEVTALTAGSPTGALASHLTYGVKIVGGATCNASTYAGSSNVVVPAGSALSVGWSASPTGPALQAAGGNQVNYCFAVTLPPTADNNAQGQTASQTWSFTAESR